MGPAGDPARVVPLAVLVEIVVLLDVMAEELLVVTAES